MIKPFDLSEWVDRYPPHVADARLAVRLEDGYLVLKVRRRTMDRGGRPLTAGWQVSIPEADLRYAVDPRALIAFKLKHARQALRRGLRTMEV